MKVVIHWFRRDLRLDDNVSLHHALNSSLPVIPLFIFDKNILDRLPSSDPRVQFIHRTLEKMNKMLPENRRILVEYGYPEEIWRGLISRFDIQEVFINRDYEPYALQRDQRIGELLKEKGIGFKSFKDQVIFEPGEIVKDDGKPYTVYTPYSKKCLAHFTEEHEVYYDCSCISRYFEFEKTKDLPALSEMGFEGSPIEVRPFDTSTDLINRYEEQRNFPSVKGTSDLSPHLRFGTVSVRAIVRQTKDQSLTFLKELFWREFFMQILYHFPHVMHQSFRPQYDLIEWRNNEEEFAKWCQGKTGYPMVDAGMRELNQTGYMHNRVRMVVASFLCKHLLIDWRWGEAYFAEKLLDFELASNNGNWQWAAGTGCDAAPYFRVFNPTTQFEKFDPDQLYVSRWVPEYGSSEYVEPMVDHKMARERAIASYKKGLGK